MRLQSAFPVPALRDCVRRFQERKAHIVGGVVAYPIAARPEQILEFYLQDPYRVRFGDSVTPEILPRSVVVGPCTYRRAELVLEGRLDVFTISFQASGFHQLFGMPMTAFADQAYDASSVIGPVASEIEEKLAEASDFHARVRIVTIFLMQLLREVSQRDFVAAIANRFLRERGALRIGDAAAKAGLSVRQFERRFAERVGLPPKRYAKIVRFQAALEAKIAAPRRLWTDIAHDVGYYDQMHMVRDFERFAGESPTAFIKRFGMMSEPWA